LIAVLVLAMLATVMAGAGCRSGRTPEISQDFLQLANNQPKNIDPAKASSNPDLEIMRACYETLVEIDPVTMEVVPVLATSWTANDNKIVWTFELRPGVKFHDGSALTAQGVKAALERALSIGAGESYLISSIDTIEAVSERTLKITLKRSEPEFIYAIGRIFIPSAAAIQAHEVDGDRAEAWFAQNEAGSGAFTITKWEKEVEIVLHRFNDYWRGWEGKHLTSVTFRVVAEPGTQRLMMERGDGDFADNIVAEDAEALKNNANLNVLVEVGANPMYIMFNPTGPLADVRVRKAIALAFDYDAMIDDIMLGYTDPLRGPIPERLIGFNNTIQRTQKNLEESRRLLQEAGVTNVTLTFMYFQPWLFEKSAGLLLQEALAPMGVNIEIEAQPWATFVEKARNPQTRPSMGMIAVYVPSPTAGSILRTLFHSSSQGHWAYWGYNNPDIDRLLDQAVVTTDDAERIALYQQVQKIVTEEYAGMWVMNRPDIHVFRNTVKGYRYNPFYPLILNYYDLYKEG
jgi:peptide/nickel transport system substrate-binding protein